METIIEKIPSDIHDDRFIYIKREKYPKWSEVYFYLAYATEEDIKQYTEEQWIHVSNNHKISKNTFVIDQDEWGDDVSLHINWDFIYSSWCMDDSMYSFETCLQLLNELIKNLWKRWIHITGGEIYCENLYMDETDIITSKTSDHKIPQDSSSTTPGISPQPSDS